ncbi:MAG: methyltransferase [Bacteroidota bacterium]
MRLGLRPDSVPERAALALGLVPTPFLHTHPTLLLARALMAAVEHGLFESLADGPQPAPEVARACGTHPAATEALLDALVGAGYLERRGEGYALRPVARRWLLPESPCSLVDSIRFRALEWDWIARLDDFLVTGEPLDFHQAMSEEEWGLYQRGMLALARLAVPETVRRAPVPDGARTLLDLGGSHGAFASAFCDRYTNLRATVLDLPEALVHAAPLLNDAAPDAGVRARITHRAGDALADDLGVEAWDVVFVGQLVHHFGEDAGRSLVRRIARALRPGGVLIVQEVMRDPAADDQLGTLAGLYFALTSAAGTRTFEEIAGWQREAGLAPQRSVRFRTLPGVGQQNAVKQRTKDRGQRTADGGQKGRRGAREPR